MIGNVVTPQYVRVILVVHVGKWKTLAMVHPPNLLKSKLSLENKQVHGLLASFPFRKPKKNSKEVVIHAMSKLPVV